MAEDLARVRVRATDESKGAFDSIKRSVTELDGAFGKIKGTLAGLGIGVSVGGFAMMVQGAIRAQSTLDDLSEKTSLTVETLSSLQQVAHIGGQDLNEVSSIASRFAKSVAEAAGGNQQLLASFQALGISQEQLRSKKFDDLFVEFAQKIANAKNQTYAIAYATDLAGRSAANAMPFFRDLAEEGLKVARVTAEQAAAAEKLEKDWRRLTDVWQESKNELATGLVPWMIKLVEQMNEMARLGGGLLGQLGGTPGEFFFGQSIRDTIGNIDSHIEQQQRIRQRRLERGLSTVAADAELADLARQRQFALFRERQEALELIAGARGRLDPRDLGPRPGFNLPPPPDSGSDAERLRAARDYAEAFERASEMEREAWSFVPKMEAALKDRERWENMFGPEITTGKTNEELREFHKNLIEGLNVLQNIEETNMLIAGGFDEHGNALKRNTEQAREFGLVFEAAASDAIRNWQGVEHLLKSILLDMAQVAFMQNVSRPLGVAATSFFSGLLGGGGGDIPGGEIAAQHGADFIVGGSGGADSQLVRIMATPGERVTVTPPGHGGGPVIYADMRGASVEAVVRLERLVMQLHGTLEQRAVAAVFNQNVRGVRV